MKITELSYAKARQFFMEPQSYGSTELPSYFDLNNILAVAEKSLSHHSLTKTMIHAACGMEGVNYTLIDNKDGKYAWRPLQFIHPYLYAELVHVLTTPGHWKELVGRFATYNKLEKIRCASIPVVKDKKEKLKAEQILNWWSEFEQASLAQALKYRMMFSTDVTDCYGSIYTHSIVWALHGKDVAKGRREDGTLLGSMIDKRIQAMRFGQTNGIPQGSVLMDFIAEIVLGYVDELLDIKLRELGIDDYYILRYRDDYRIYVNDSSFGEKILKELTVVLSGLGMRLNSSKTRISNDVVLDSVKHDKLEWLSIDNNFRNLSLEKKLLLLYDHATRFPNCGSIMRPLTDLHSEFDEIRFVGAEQTIACIAILVELAYRNPKCYHVCMALLAKFIVRLNHDERKQAAQNVLEKFKHLPNTGYLQIWLQRIMLPCDIKLDYSERMCLAVDNSAMKIWEHEWLSEDAGLWGAMSVASIIDAEKLKELQPTISNDEVNLFATHYQEGYQG
ncbi:MAG: RNA-directed DNA polymerase [Kiritimatiellae bacterium]|nr:RNA-directed DNA polymerase [Kiritimatiellia bacterium]